MTSYRDTILERQTVELDGCEFINCSLVQCQLVFRGLEAPRMVDTVFDGCNWTFAESAGVTMAFLRALYDSFGDSGQVFIEMLFRRTGEG